MFPYQNPTTISKAFSFIKNIKWGALLDGTQKTLGVINQAIPIVYQVKPIINNAKTMFNIAKIMNDPTDTVTSTKSSSTASNNSPIFYI